MFPEFESCFYPNIAKMFSKILLLLEEKKLNLNEPLEKMILLSSMENLSYVDGRKTARKLGFDFWENLRKKYGNDEDLARAIGINTTSLYSDSGIFPDFIFKLENKDRPIGGEILEIKDSTGSSIASFNSTLPTEFKSLADLRKINGVKGELLIKVLKNFEDNRLKYWKTHKRKVFYFVRTNKGKEDIRISLVDGAFFETLPEKALISFMFENIFRRHSVPEDILKKASKIFGYITDHSRISFSQDIPKASIKPRLRIMAEVKKEGNPHWNAYGIPSKTFNLIVKAEEAKDLSFETDTEIMTIDHKNNGKFVVFSYKVHQ